MLVIILTISGNCWQTLGCWAMNRSRLALTRSWDTFVGIINNMNILAPLCLRLSGKPCKRIYVIYIIILYLLVLHNLDKLIRMMQKYVYH